MLCAQGVSPQAATIERFRSLGHELVPGTGLLAACVPGSFGGWLLLLERFGTWRLEDVLAYAIGYAEDGYPVVPAIVATIRNVEALLRELAGLGRAVPAAAAGRTDVPEPRACRDVATPARRSTAAARARTRSSVHGVSTTRASSPRRSTASHAKAAGS